MFWTVTEKEFFNIIHLAITEPTKPYKIWDQLKYVMAKIFQYRADQSTFKKELKRLRPIFSSKCAVGYSQNSATCVQKATTTIQYKSNNRVTPKMQCRTNNRDNSSLSRSQVYNYCTQLIAQPKITKSSQSMCRPEGEGEYSQRKTTEIEKKRG